MRSVEDILLPIEAEVVGLILKGYSSKEISAILKIIAETVQTQMQRVHHKLSRSSVVEAMVQQLGLAVVLQAVQRSA